MTDSNDKDNSPQLDASEHNDAVVENSKDRRDALRSIVAGGGAVTAAVTSDKWAKPVIDSLVLPAHAQTSPDTSGDATTTAAPGASTTMAPEVTTTMAPVSNAVGNFTSGMSMFTLTSPLGAPIDEYLVDESISEELLEFFMPAAHAQSGSTACDLIGNCSVDINATFTETNANFCFSGDLSGIRSAPVTTMLGSASTVADTAELASSFRAIRIVGGTFNEGSGNWDLDVVPGGDVNSSTMIELAPGGGGCGNAG